MKDGEKGYVLKLREGRMRRPARRQGLRLIKSSRRDPLAVDFGTYWLADNRHNVPILGDQFGVSLDDIEQYLLHRHEEMAV
jgi:hypothetical protein